MSELLATIMSGARQVMKAQAVNANNLANASTDGFRAELVHVESLDTADGISGSPDFTQGMIRTTGRNLDVAVNGDGWIAIQTPDGGEGYTRRGDLKIDEFGQLSNGVGQPVMGNGGPIAVPPAESMQIGVDGTISIRPVGQEANTLAQLDRIKLVNPDLSQLTKGADGLFHMKDGSTAPADALVKVQQGALEASNVNTVSELVNMITLQRNFELQVKAMHTAEQNDSAATRLMNMAA